MSTTGRRASTLLVATALACGAWIPRILGGLDRGFAGTVPGFVADLGVALALLIVFLWLGDRRLPRAILAATWVLLHWVSYEHVRALDASLAWHQAGYLLDPDFLRGSGFTVSRPVVLLVLLGGVAASASLPRLRPRRGTWLLALGATAVTGGIALAWPGTEDGSWRSQSVVGAAVSALGDRSGRAPPQALAPDVDLSAPRWAPATAHGSNVVLVVLEGVSGAYLPTIRELSGAADPGLDLPRLDALAKRHPVAVQFLNLQRQTNRGLWSILCGRFPRPDRSTAHLSDLAFLGRPPSPPCLPEVLARRGWRSVFLQASPLAFMQKDRAMPLLGFRRVLGDEYGDDRMGVPRARSGWGVDDHTFLRLARREIERLRAEDEPFFLTLLTAGTHHPYAVPGDRSLGGAMAYLDTAVGDFVSGLARDGVLDDTLVILTSDESVGALGAPDGSGVEALDLVQSHGLAILLGSGLGESRTLFTPFSQADLPLSIVDFLQPSLTQRSSPFGGRSLFRVYADDRAIPFANIHLRRVSLYQPGEGVITCSETGTSCRLLESRSGPFRLSGASTPTPSPAAVRRWLGLEDARAVSPGTVVPLRRDRLVAVDEKPSGTILFDGQYLLLEKGTALVLRLSGEVEGGDGWLHLQQDLVSRELRKRPVSFPVLAPGDEFVLRYRLTPETTLHHLSVRASANLVEGGPLRIRLKEAELAFEKAEEGAETVEILEWSVDRRQSPPLVSFGLDPEDAETADCVQVRQGRWVMDGCAAGEILAGPRRYLPSGSRLVARWRIRVLSGEIVVRAVAGSRRPPIVFARTMPARLAAGEARDLVLRSAVEPSLDHVLPALFLEASTPAARWAVEEAEMVVSPP